MYHHDGLQTVHNSSFLEDTAFKDAYSYTRDLIGKDYNWMWRNYIGISLASNARHNSLNFVECGVGEGWMSISILRYFARNYKTTPSITLFDTWSGIDEKIVDPEEINYWGCTVKERKAAYIYENSSFTETRDKILKTALNPQRVEFIQGSIPKSLTDEVINRINGKGPISFLHIDMNNSVPEVSAMEKLYPIVSKGGIILLDDYAYTGYEFQKQKMDLFCDSIGIDHPIALPSGQGLLIRTT